MVTAWMDPHQHGPLQDDVDAESISTIKGSEQSVVANISHPFLPKSRSECQYNDTGKASPNEREREREREDHLKT